MSVRVVLDLLDQFTNTTALSLFHNRMWQSKYSEVNCSPRSALIARYLTCVKASNGFPSSFKNFSSPTLKFVLSWEGTCLGGSWLVTCVTADNGLPHSITMIWAWNELVWWELLDCWTTCPSGRWATSESNSFIQSLFQGNLWRWSRWRI